jgi:hypothetical protein
MVPASNDSQSKYQQSSDVWPAVLPPLLPPAGGRPGEQIAIVAVAGARFGPARLMI